MQVRDTWQAEVATEGHLLHGPLLLSSRNVPTTQDSRGQGATWSGILLDAEHIPQQEPCSKWDLGPGPGPGCLHTL